MGKAPGLRLQAAIVQDNVPTEVAPGLFIGSIHAAFNVEELQQNNVTHIVNVSGNDAIFPENFVYLNIGIRDKEYSNILSCVPFTKIFIENAIKRGGAVFVHCTGGRSRSPALAISYLMTTQRISFEEALSKVKTARPLVSLNAGFEAQLKSLHLANFDVFAAHQLLLRYQLSKIAKQHVEGVLDADLSGKQMKKCNRIMGGKVPFGFILSAPSGERQACFIPALRSMGTQYACKQCGENLFCSSSILRHEENETESKQLQDLQKSLSNDKALRKQPFCELPVSRDLRDGFENDQEEVILPSSTLPPPPAAIAVATTVVDDTEIVSHTAVSKERTTLRKLPLLAKFRKGKLLGARPASSLNLSSPEIVKQETNKLGLRERDSETTKRVRGFLNTRKTREKTSAKRIDAVKLNKCVLPDSNDIANSSGDAQLDEVLSRAASRAASQADPNVSKSSTKFWRLLKSTQLFFKENTRNPATTLEDQRVCNSVSVDDQERANILKENLSIWQKQISSVHENGLMVTSSCLSGLIAADTQALNQLECRCWYIEPQPWFFPKVRGNPSGSLLCPNASCSQVVGKWNWDGLKCACGSFITPGFQIERSAIKMREVVTSLPSKK